MSMWDAKALETNFEGWRKDRVPDLPKHEAFERYVVEAVFNDKDLSDEEISSGLLGGGNDGGVDGAYFFIDRTLMLDDSPVPEKPITAEVWLIQAKSDKSFSEAPIMKLWSFTEDMLDFDRDLSSFPVYSARVKEFINSFRQKLSGIIGKLTELRVNFVYASNSVYEPSAGVKHRVDELRSRISHYLSSAKTGFDFWDARRLLDAWRSQPTKTYSLEVVNYFSQEGSFVALARLDKFAAFLTDDNGQLRQGFLDPNVRDYNGPANPVNKEIRATLEAGVAQEFWWLNNGITVLAEACNFAGGRLNITTPEIVNGLQTSHEIYNFFRLHKLDDKRLVLIRVILPPNDAVRRRIVKATNSQTAVNPLSLHANDDIHFDIEELFRLHGLYYDRRKGEYRRKAMPVASIVSMTDVAQAVIAVALRAPDDARARPRNRLSTEAGYADVFDAKAERQMFLTAILIDRAVSKYLSSREDVTRDERANIRFYMDTWLAAELAQKPEPTKNEIAALVHKVKASLNPSMLGLICSKVREIYASHGADDTAAKGSMMREHVLQIIKGTVNANATA